MIWQIRNVLYYNNCSVTVHGHRERKEEEMKYKKQTILAIIVMLGIAVFFVQSSTPAKPKIRLSSSKLSMTAGDSKKLTLKGISSKDQSKVSWESSAPGIASVNKKGKVTAKKAGNAVITARYKGKKYSCRVRVESKSSGNDNNIPDNGTSNNSTNTQGASTVYFTSDISPKGLKAVYDALAWKPEGKVAAKLSTGEPPASNYLAPELIKDLVQSVNASIVECNAAYGGSRAETAMHRQVAKDHGFTAIADVDILDADGSMELPVTGGTHLKTNLVGSHFSDYDSYMILSHFKGHAMAGFGGAIKNISIGLGSSEGKCLIHTAGKSHTSPWGGDQTGFTEAMAEAGKSVSDYLGNGKRIVYINVLNNISIDCDCDGNPAKPEIHDIGIAASLDPVAIDQACIDLAFAADGSESLQARVNSRNGLHTLEHAEKIGLGSRTYELVNVQ